MERKEIFEKVKGIIENYVAPPRDYNIDGSTKLKEDLCCDSLDGVEISLELDKKFGIRTDDKDIETINNGTVDDIVDLVERLLTKKNKKS